jgi:hypothetical protein
MITKKKKIRKIEPYNRMIPLGNDAMVAVINPDSKLLEKIGFSKEPKNGDTVLPRPQGEVSMFNAEGKQLVHKNLPMETAYRTIEWHWTEWHGRYDRIERSDFRDRPYKRYPRTFVSPPGLELTVMTDVDGNRVLSTPVVKDWKNNKNDLIHAVNLILEIFGECVFYNEKMERLIKAPILRLNWRLLPPGQRPFQALRRELENVFSSIKGGNRSFTEHRLEIINAYNPDFAALGQGGFYGYVVLGFTKKDMYVLESLLYGNATYVFGENWESLSKKTKAEILDKNLQKDRVIHHKAWDKEISAVLR